MIAVLAFYVAKYGLIIVFSLIFLQEAGIPSALPNETMLLFAGFLASTGKLHLIPLIIVAVAGDFIGSSVLYAIFYYFDSGILDKHRLSVIARRSGLCLTGEAIPLGLVKGLPQRQSAAAD